MEGKGRELTSAQKAHVERNRQKALLLKQARLSVHPYVRDRQTAKGLNQMLDTGAGFFLEQKEEKIQTEIHQQPGPLIPEVSDRLLCEECGQEFLESFLSSHFDLSVCDSCREKEEKYALITKTDAKKKYLLKDADFDVREPSLRFILRKNPHNQQWGDMKLFLELQVEARSLEVWGDEDRLEKEKAERAVKKEKAKKRKFDKRVKELRMAVRSSTWRRETTAHQHEFGEESYHQDTQEYSQTCNTCGHVITFEKM
ncbi:DNA repair protein complementing XP-A cells homolog [Babylonia areolata]|uniref:DNA repair protein complementing XP-A cells homolog n=1 Tax=Babylonia areolata TaxID=304850 RepID=UPI003FD33809